MSTSMWAEIERLRDRLNLLTNRVSQQNICLSNISCFRVGDVLARTNNQYALKDREGTYTSVRILEGDTRREENKQPYAHTSDCSGRYLLPLDQHLILIQDQGNDTGKQVQVNENGIVSELENTSLPLVVAEPDSNFHGNYPFKAGRIYPGIKLKDQKDVEFYCVFMQGFGEKTSTVLNIGVGDLTIEHDTAGHIIDTSIVLIPQGASILWVYKPSGVVPNTGTWYEVIQDNAGPSKRYGSNLFYDRFGQLYTIGGVDACTGEVCSDFWKINLSKIGDDYHVTWTQQADPPFGATAFSSIKQDAGYMIWLLGGWDSNKNKTKKFWYFDAANWTQLPNCPRAIAGASMTHLYNIKINGTPCTGFAVVDPTDHQNPLFWRWFGAWGVPDTVWHYGTWPVDTGDSDYYPWASHTNLYEAYSGNLCITWVLAGWWNAGGVNYGWSAYRVKTGSSGQLRYEQYAYNFDENNYFLKYLTTNASAYGWCQGTPYPVFRVFAGLRNGVKNNRMFDLSPLSNHEQEQTYLTGDTPEARKDHTMIKKGNIAILFGGRT